MPRNEAALFYQLYFQEPGVAEAEFESDPRRSLHAMLYGGSGDRPPSEANAAVGMVARGGRFLDIAPDPLPLPSWLTQDDLDFYGAEFARTGFRGGLNWYRNIDRNWELLSPFKGAKVTIPALYVAGDRDMVVAFPGAQQLIAGLKTFVPKLTRTVMLPGCGHWTQQERVAEVSAAMSGFVNAL
jgi:pimeloyl-ACP methyl ester carboxylesterase